MTRPPSPRARYSLRLRVFLAVTFAALSLPLLVFAVSQLERGAPGALWQKTLEATDEAARIVEASDGPNEERVAAIAEKYRARVRIVPRLDGPPPLDVDRDDPRDAFGPVEAFFFLRRSTTTSKDWDSATPVLARDETSYAIDRGLYIDCFRDDVRVCRAVRAPKDRAGRGWVVYVDKSSARAVEEVYFVRRTLLRLSLVTVPLALLLAVWVSRRVTRPIALLRTEALAKANGARRGDDLTEHADEVGDLAAALNTLLAALAERKSANEAFVADVVHEMKSPVAAVTAIAEALEAPVDDERRKRLATALGASAKKLDALVTQFLALARAEAGMPREEREEVDLGALARDAVERARLDPRHAETTFVTRAEGDTTVRGVASRLDALVRELVENAATFAGEGGTVTVELEPTARAIVLRVSDDGPGIAADDLERVFDRFYTTRGEKRGTGLGLALVRAVAEAHRGRAHAESPAEGGRGARFLVELARGGEE